MTNHVQTKHVLRDVGSLTAFEDILALTTLNEEEKKFLRLYYIEKKDLRYIADTLNLGGEKQASRMHGKLLRTISKVI